jgi:hypothetical protein
LAWRYRKSLRFPGGFKLNLSKSGIGYSWGFRGFRVGRDSRGRVARTVSIPGTGIYNRQFLSGSKTQQPDTDTQNSGCGCGGCISTLVFVFLGLLIFGKLTESGNTIGIGALVLVALVVYVIWQFRGPPPVTPPQNYELLGQEVKVMFDTLAVPVKNELRKSRGVTAYESVFEMAFTDLICRFASLDGVVTPSEAKVYLDVFTVLHPRNYGGLSADSGVTLLEKNRQGHPDAFQTPVCNSLLVRLTQQAGEPFTTDLRELMYKVALQVALADGPLSPAEQAELEALRSPSEATGLQHGSDPVVETNTLSEPVAATIPVTSPNVTGVEGLHIPTPVFEGSQHPLVDPQFQTATGLVTVDILKQKTKELVEALEPLLKAELRKVRRSSTTRDFVEQDIREVIVRLGSIDGRVSRYAAHLYLELFKYMHPKTYSAWTIDSVLRFCEQIMETNQETYVGTPKKLYTLRLIETFDAEHSTAVTKSVREALLIIGCFAASVDGKVSEEKAAEIARLKAVFEAVGQ